MFDNLTKNISAVFDKLKGRAVISESDVNDAMREVRIALLEADVALPVAKDFIEKIKQKAIGAEVVKSISPAQMVIKIVHDELKDFLGGSASEINLNVVPPAVILMAGLQGSGKTTTSGKLALRLKTKNNKKVLLASTDIYRPAAQEQLEKLAKNNGITSLEIVSGEKPEKITERALKKAKLEHFDILIIDTAGRQHADSELIEELKRIKEISNPAEILLVADALTGQDAVNIAKNFNEAVNLTGIVLTRVDGDGRGGAALSMKAVTGAPIKYIGVGEKISELEEFHPERIASRILGMGDIITLVEKAKEAVDVNEAEALAKKIQKSGFDMEDLKSQLKNMKKMGGLSGMMGLIPGISKLKDKIDAAGGIDDKLIDRQIAIINSMTKKERVHPKTINGSRKKRIAAGSGTTVQEVNKILKQHLQMADMLKKFSGMDKKTLMRSGLGNLLK